MSDAEVVATALFDLVGDPVWMVDPDLTLMRDNGACRIFRAKAGDAFERAWRELAPRVLAGRSVTSDLRVVLDGVERSFTITGAPAGRMAIFVARDVTDTARGDSEDALELAVARIFAGDKPLPQLLEHVLAFIGEVDNWDCGVAWLVNLARGELEPAALWSRIDVDARKFQQRVAALRFVHGHGIPGRAWASEDVVWVPDLFEESGLVRAESAAASGLHGTVAVPLRDGAQIVGVLELLSRAARPLSEQGRRALSRAGSSLGRLIERRKLESLIERKGREWGLTFDAIELPIFITTLGGAITRLNRAARDVAGASDFSDVLGRPISLADRQPWRTLADTIAAVRDSRLPCTAQIAEGDRTWDVSASWYFSESDGDDRAIVVMRDTTDLVRLQESVRRGEQLAALGELVAGVAHEVRNPIFGMGLAVDAIQVMLPDDEEFAELASVLRTWLDRLNGLMETLLEYGKTWTIDLRQGNLAEVMDGAVARCRQISPAIAIDASVAPDLPMLMDATRVGQAFDNLITNAVQHSGPEDRVEVSAALQGDTIECAIRDRGPGFDLKDLPKIFQPFFTRRRGGTGLGLSIVQRIVDEHGGTVAASNAEGGGALVIVRFPVHRATP
jgi:signal transduction histidine kinase